MTKMWEKIWPKPLMTTFAFLSVSVIFLYGSEPGEPGWQAGQLEHLEEPEEQPGPPGGRAHSEAGGSTSPLILNNDDNALLH
jgi:hypothetical protein